MALRGSADKTVSHLELPNDQFCLDAEAFPSPPYPRLPSATSPKQNYLGSWGPQINECGRKQAWMFVNALQKKKKTIPKHFTAKLDFSYLESKILT